MYTDVQDDQLKSSTIRATNSEFKILIYASVSSLILLRRGEGRGDVRGEAFGVLNSRVLARRSRDASRSRSRDIDLRRLKIIRISIIIYTLFVYFCEER